MTVAIGVDIGGSAIKFAVVDEAGAIVWPATGAPDRVAYSVATPGSGRLTWQSTGDVEEYMYEPGPGDRRQVGRASRNGADCAVSSTAPY